MIGLGFDKMIGCWRWTTVPHCYKSWKVVGFLVWFFFCLHTIASRVFHAKIRALSFFSVLEEPRIKLWPLKTFGVFTVKPFREKDEIYDGACSSGRIWLGIPRSCLHGGYQCLNFQGTSHSCPLFHPRASASLSRVSKTLGHRNFHTWLARRQWSAEAAERQRKGLSAITALIQMHPYMRGHWYAHIYLCIHISSKTYLPFRYAHIL